MLFKSCRRLLTAQIRQKSRMLVTEAEAELKTPKETRKRKKRDLVEPAVKKVPKDMITYFNAIGSESMLQKFPQQALKKKSRAPDGLYITHEDAAEVIAEALLKDLDKDQTLIEANPGAGFLSKRLMNSTSNNLMFYEPTKMFHSSLQDLIGERSAVIKDADLSTLWRLAFIDKLEKGNRVDDALKGIRRTEYESDSNARLFIATGSLVLLKYLINSVIFQNGLISYGRCELFLCLPPYLMRHLTCSNEAGYMMYRATSVLFQLMFEYEFLGELDRKHFLPWQSEGKTTAQVKLSSFKKLNAGSMFLMKAVPRQNLFRYCTPENLAALWYFVHQNMTSRKNRVIPTLERWIPGCGPRLIVNRKAIVAPTLMHPNLDLSKLPKFIEPCRTLSNEDFVGSMNIFTEFGDLTPTQVLTLFDQFTSWPEYVECPFTASLENYLMKTQLNSDEHGDELEQPYDEEIEIVKE